MCANDTNVIFLVLEHFLIKDTLCSDQFNTSSCRVSILETHLQFDDPFAQLLCVLHLFHLRREIAPMMDCLHSDSNAVL